MCDYEVISHNTTCYQNSMWPVRREDQQVSSQERALVGGAASSPLQIVRSRSKEVRAVRFMPAQLSPLPRTHSTLLLLHTECIGAHFCLSVYYNIHRTVYKKYIYLMNCILLDNHR